MFGPHDWLDGMAPDLFDHYVAMLSRIEAERRLAGIGQVALGSGAVKDSRTHIDALRRMADPEAELRRRKRGPKEALMRLAAMGIPVVVEPREEQETTGGE